MVENEIQKMTGTFARLRQLKFVSAGFYTLSQLHFSALEMCCPFRSSNNLRLSLVRKQRRQAAVALFLCPTCLVPEQIYQRGWSLLSVICVFTPQPLTSCYARYSQSLHPNATL